jgi:hypothetical protein
LVEYYEQVVLAKESENQDDRVVFENVLLPYLKSNFKASGKATHSPFDGELHKQNPELIEKYKKGILNNSSPNLVGDYLDCSVMSSIYSFPLIDITERFVPWYRRNTFPSPFLIGLWRTSGNIGRTPQRIDYILTTQEMSLNCKK